MNPLILQPIRSAADVRDLVRAAAADEHQVIGATHIIPNSAGEIVGYVSLGGVPVMHVWVDSNRVKARESLSLMLQAEAVMRSQGHKAVLVPCAESSPFFGHMSRLGFNKLGATVLHIKDLVNRATTELKG